VTDWDARFLDLAAHIGTWSKDPSVGTGCVIARQDRTVASLGYNGLPRWVVDRPERLADRETKLAMTIHAEANAILTAKEPLWHYDAFVHPWPPCSSCAGMLIQVGIHRVVAPTPTAEQGERWGDSWKLAEEMFAEAKVILDLRESV
jgi:dCMP deaminase